MDRHRGILAGVLAGLLTACAPADPASGGTGLADDGRASTEGLADDGPAPLADARPAAPAPRLLRFEARPERIAAGTSTPVRLVWEAAGAVEVEIVDDTGRRVLRELRSPEGGELLVAPDRSQDFVLTAHGRPGTAPAVARLRVSAYFEEGEPPLEPREVVLEPPEVVRFSVDPPAFTEGAGPVPVRVGWKVPGAQNLAVVADPGGPLDLSLQDPAQGEVVVHLDTPTRFELVAENRWGRARAETRALMVPPPRIERFEVEPGHVGAGDTVTLAWETRDAATVVLEKDGRPVALDPRRTAGRLDDGPAVDDAVWTLRAANAVGDEVRRKLRVTVGRPVIRSFSASDGRVAPGGAVSLSWEVRGATALRIEDEVGRVLPGCATLDPARVVAGECEVRPKRTGRFVLRAVNGSGETRAPAGILVADGPVVRSFDTAAERIDEGDDVIVSWRILPDLLGHAPRLSLTDERGTAYDLRAAEALEGAARIAAPGPGLHHYTLVAETDGTSPDSASVSVRVLPSAKVDAFEASRTTLVAGETVTLSYRTRHADTVEVSPLPVDVTELPTGLVDVRSLPGAVRLTGADPHVEVAFPGGFAFPWFGAARTAARVSGKGYLCFSCTGEDVSEDHVLPYGAEPQGGILAPFWGDLQAGPSSALWMHHDRAADSLTFQWTGWQPPGGEGILDFQVVLLADGRFELRYGRMESAAPRLAAGEGATIGFEDDAGDRGYTFAHRERVTGGLDGRGWRFDPAVPRSGRLRIRPRRTQTYELLARGPGGDARASARVEVIPAARILETRLEPSEVQADRPFDLQWRTLNATRVRVRDGSGAVLCRATGPAAARGACTLSEPGAGTRQYVVEAVGRLARDVVGEVVTVDVVRPLSIDAFTVAGRTDAAAVSSGAPVRLAWETTGAASVRLYEGGEPLGVFGGSGVLVRRPAATVDYALEITDGPGGRVRRAERTVLVDPARVDLVEVTPAVLAPGESARLSWRAVHADSVLVSPTEPLVHREDAVLEDVSATGARLQLGGGGRYGPGDDGTATLQLPAGFTFPFEGRVHDRLTVSADGYLTFGEPPAPELAAQPAPFPHPGAPTGGVIAPFLDDLEARPSSSLAWRLGRDGAGRYLVVQWTGFTFWHVDGPDPRYDLTFQAVLRERGDFELRYGEMGGAGDPGRPSGGTAGIGYEDHAGAHGARITWRKPLPGGLTGTAFHVDPTRPPVGSVTVSPDETTVYTVCAVGGRDVDCREVVVEVVPAMAWSAPYTPATLHCDPDVRPAEGTPAGPATVAAPAPVDETPAGPDGPDQPATS